MKEWNKLYTIGQMAQLCNVSAKQLRYYDENGIISPAYKDEKTLYRYYLASQMQEILLLKELKKMDLPLKDIAEILKDRNIPLLKQKLMGWLSVAREEFKSAWVRYDQMMELYTRISEAAELLEREDFFTASVEDIRVVEMPVRWVACTRYQSYWNVNALFTERRAEVYQLVDEYELVTKGPISAIFHGGYRRQFSDREEDQEGDLEILIEIDNIKDCPSCRKMGKLRAVSTIHIGPYPSLLETYQLMEEWAKSQGLELMDISIEEYVCGATITYDESKYVTRVYIPLKGSSV